jgi:hypothetical protein
MRRRLVKGRKVGYSTEVDARDWFRLVSPPSEDPSHQVVIGVGANKP